MPEEISAVLSAGIVGELVGPVETDRGTYAIYRVTSRETPKLDEGLRARLTRVRHPHDWTRLYGVV
jgi:hypothetical protein